MPWPACAVRSHGSQTQNNRSNGRPLIRSDVVRAKGGSKARKEAAVVSQRSDETARPCLHPSKSKPAEGARQTRVDRSVSMAVSGP